MDVTGFLRTLREAELIQLEHPKLIWEHRWKTVHQTLKGDVQGTKVV